MFDGTRKSTFFNFLKKRLDCVNKHNILNNKTIFDHDHFCMCILYGRYEDTLCPRKTRNFSTQKDPRPVGVEPTILSSVNPYCFRAQFLSTKKEHTNAENSSSGNPSSLRSSGANAHLLLNGERP